MTNLWEANDVILEINLKVLAFLSFLAFIFCKNSYGKNTL